MMNSKKIITSILKGDTFLLTPKKDYGTRCTNCIYAKSVCEIPHFLIEDGAIEVNKNGSINLYDVECYTVRKFPVYIYYSEVHPNFRDKLPGKYRAVPKDDGDTTLKVINGKCYNLSHAALAALVTETVPNWVTDSALPITRIGNIFKLKRIDKTVSGQIGKALWVEYGSKDIRILKITEKNASEYFVTYKGHYIGTLDMLLPLKY